MLKPKSAAAVRATLTVVTLAVPKRVVIRSLSRLETTVPRETIMNTIPEAETSTPKSGYILGQAAPSRPSGRPREINDR